MGLIKWLMRILGKKDNEYEKRYLDTLTYIKNKLEKLENNINNENNNILDLRKQIEEVKEQIETLFNMIEELKDSEQDEQFGNEEDDSKLEEMIIEYISKGITSPSDLLDETGLSKSKLYSILRRLTKKGILEKRREGRRVHYMLASNVAEPANIGNSTSEGVEVLS